MMGEQEAKPTRRRTTRSHSGCSYCKRRRVRCDETKPTCRNCERMLLQCPGYPEKRSLPETVPPKTQRPRKRVAPAAAEPTYGGRSSKLSRPPEASSLVKLEEQAETILRPEQMAAPGGFASGEGKLEYIMEMPGEMLAQQQVAEWRPGGSLVGPFMSSHSVHVSLGSPPASDVSSQLSATLSPDAFSQHSMSLQMNNALDHCLSSPDPLMDSRLMLYYVSRFAHVFAVSKRGVDVFTKYIPSMSMTHDLLLHSILSVSAAQQSMNESHISQKSLLAIASLHSQAAIVELSAVLGNGEARGQNVQALLATCVLLAWKDYIVGDLTAAYQHAVGAATLLRQHGSQIVHDPQARELISMLLRLHLASKQLILVKQAEIDDELIDADIKLRESEIQSSCGIVSTTATSYTTPPSLDYGFEMHQMRVMRLLNKLTVLDKRFPDLTQDPCKFDAVKIPFYDELLASFFGCYANKGETFAPVPAPPQVEAAISPLDQFELDFPFLYYRSPTIAIALAQYHRGVITAQRNGSPPWATEPPYVLRSMMEVMQIAGGLLNLRLHGLFDPAVLTAGFGMLAPMSRAARVVRSPALRAFFRYWYDSWYDEGVCKIFIFRLVAEVMWARLDLGHKMFALDIKDPDSAQPEQPERTPTQENPVNLEAIEVVQVDAYPELPARVDNKGHRWKSRIICGKAYGPDWFVFTRYQWVDEHIWHPMNDVTRPAYAEARASSSV